MAEPVGYVGRMTGGTLRDSGAESVGYIGERRSEKEEKEKEKEKEK